jgi:hypothetical protein
VISRPIWQPIARRMGRIVSSAATSTNRGPELIGTAFASWTFSGATVTGDGTGLHFVAAASGDNARLTIVTEDNATYEVIYTVANRSAGSVVAHVYGPTSGHHGNGASISANGQVTQQILTTGASSILSQIRFISGATTTLDITAVSVKKVLA